MGVSLGGSPTVRFIYCHHVHDEDQPCTTECIHSPECEKAGHHEGRRLS
jgi:hypothetical protein